MNSLRITVLGDGSSDANLQPIIEWVLRDKFPHCPYQVTYAHHLRTDGLGLSVRLAAAVRLYPCDVLIVHRDAERESPDVRCEEIRNALQSTKIEPPVVAIVPVRMTEAWLLFDESAIRSAAGNPNGKNRLQLPRLKDVEKLPDAKACIFDALKQASGLGGRKLANFNVRQARNRVADLIGDFSPLRQLAAFVQFENSLTNTIEGLV